MIFNDPFPWNNNIVLFFCCWSLPTPARRYPIQLPNQPLDVTNHFTKHSIFFFTSGLCLVSIEEGERVAAATMINMRTQIYAFTIQTGQTVWVGYSCWWRRFEYKGAWKPASQHQNPRTVHHDQVPFPSWSRRLRCCTVLWGLWILWGKIFSLELSLKIFTFRKWWMKEMRRKDCALTVLRLLWAARWDFFWIHPEHLIAAS